MATVIFGTAKNLPIFFNITAKVGENCPNVGEDVALMSYMMRTSARFVKSPEVRAVCEKTPVTSTCTPELIKCIKEFQAALKAKVDGHFSVATSSGMYSATDGFLIARTNVVIKNGTPDIWPRIDKIPDATTPFEVTQLVQRCLIGT